MTNSPHVLVGKDCRISGRMSFVGEAIIHGTLEGEVVSDGTLTVADGGVVDAKIRASRLHIYGRVVGDVVCSEHLELHAGAKVYGNLESPTVVMEDGVSFEGHCSMEEGDDVQVNASPESVVETERASPE